MPYIENDHRIKVAVDGPATASELAYVFYRTCLKYLEEVGSKFQTFADIFGAMESAKQELYRRKVGPYEDTKIVANGDVEGVT